MVTAVASLVERVVDAFKLNRFLPKFEHSLHRKYLGNPKYHQGHQPQSGMSIIDLKSTNNPSNVIDS